MINRLGDHVDLDELLTLAPDSLPLNVLSKAIQSGLKHESNQLNNTKIVKAACTSLVAQKEHQLEQLKDKQFTVTHKELVQAQCLQFPANVHCVTRRSATIFNRVSTTIHRVAPWCTRTACVTSICARRRTLRDIQC